MSVFQILELWPSHNIPRRLVRVGGNEGPNIDAIHQFPNAVEIPVTVERIHDYPKSCNGAARASSDSNLQQLVYAEIKCFRSYNELSPKEPGFLRLPN